MPNWKKVITSGSNASLNSLYAPSITGSLLGTASYAIYAETSSLSTRTTQTDLLALNQNGFTIPKGTVVRITGSNNASDIPRIVTASYENDGNSANTLGITTAAISNGATGYIITEGVLTGIDTSNFTSGTLLYLGATGSIIGTIPLAPLHAVRLGQVIREQSNNGSMHVRIDNGYEIGELHNILDTTTTASYGDLLVKSGSVWINSNQLTGSYGVTGSFNIQTYDGILANAYVPAITINNGSRTLHDMFGTASLDTAVRILIDNLGGPSLDWFSRTMFDSSNQSSIDWQFRYLYDPTSATSIDWGNRIALDALGNTSVDWEGRILGTSTIAGGNSIEWDYPTNTYAVGFNSYTRKFLDLGTLVESFSNQPIYAEFNPDGEILKGVNLDASVTEFDLVYLETDGKWYPVDMTTSSSSKLLGIAWAIGTGKEKVFLEGTMVVNDSTLGDTPQVIGVDHGLPIYIKTVSGTYMGTSPPASSGDYVRVLGHAYYQGVEYAQYWVMKFRPANDWYVI